VEQEKDLEKWLESFIPKLTDNDEEITPEEEAARQASIAECYQPLFEKFEEMGFEPLTAESFERVFG
jgi:hypothetical protein